MYQGVVFSQTRRAALLAGLVLALGAQGAGAQDIDKCKAAIAKNAQKLASAELKALQKCEEGRVKGKITTTCALDTKTQDKINKAKAKATEKIEGTCAGVTVAEAGFAGLVARCTGGNAAGARCVDNGDCQFPPATAGAEDGTCDAVTECPALLNGTLGCNALPLASANDIDDCLICTTESKVEALVATLYGALNAPSEDKDDSKCQLDIGKRTAKYLDKVEKALAKCEDGRIKGKILTTCDVDPKTQDKIAKAQSKLADAISGSCDSDARISRAIAPGELYAAGSRFGSCGIATPSTGAGLLSVLGCIADDAAACDVGLSTGDPACATPLCGNGQIDNGESCDDGNTLNESGAGPSDSCPADCSIATCAPNGTQSATVSFTAPVDLTGMTLVVVYDDSKVSIPGSNGDAAVQAAVTSGSFSSTPNDTNYALRNVLLDPFLGGVASGPAFQIQLTKCTGAPAPTAADFGCFVVDAADINVAPVAGVTCSVSVP